MDQDQNREVHLSHYWNVVIKRWRLAAAILVIVLLVTVAVSYLTTPLYQASILIQIERDNPNRITIDDLAGIAPSNQEFLRTQYALLQSRGLAERVIDDLALLDNPEFNPAGTEGLSDSEIQDLRASRAAGIIAGIRVSPVEYTSLARVFFVSTSPELAQQVANGIGDSYINLNVERRFETVRQASRFLRSEIEQLKGEIEIGERELQKFASDRDIVSLEGSGNFVLEKLSSLNSAYNRAQADRMEKESQYNSLVGANPNPGLQVDNPVVQGLRSDLLRLERDYEQKLVNLKPGHPEMLRLKDEIDGSQRNLTKAINDAVSSIRESAHNDYLAALNHEKTMERALDEQKQKAMELNLNAVDYLTLRSQVDSKRTLLGELTRQLNTTEVSARLQGSNVSNIHFVERAVTPAGRFNATTLKNLKSAVPLGLVAGLVAIFFLEYMDRSVKSSEELVKLTGFASLGIIPSAVNPDGSAYGYGYGYGYGYSTTRHLKSSLGRKPDSSSQNAEPIEVDLIPHTNARSPIAEAYRALRTSLLLSSANSPRVVVITSPMPREGKTTTAVNLAVVLAQMNKKVVVIDADLRKPRIKKIFKSRDHSGLVNFLAAKVPLGDIVQESHVPNLSFIESGPIPPNPSELLSADRMKDLVDAVRAEFDYVIIDSPPVLAVTDAVIIGAYADGIVLCVHGGETTREIVQRAGERISQANLPVLGAILNNLDLHSHGYQYSKQYYEYYADEPDTGSGRTAPSRKPQSKARAS